MTTTRATCAILIALTAACHFPSEGMGNSSDSSSSSSDDSSVTTTATVTTSVATTTTGASSSSSSDESSDDGDPTFGESATTTQGESSTGEPIESYALAFDGGAVVANNELDPWDSDLWTVELWLEISEESAAGMLVDHQVSDYSGGWYVQFDYLNSNRIMFSFWDLAGSHPTWGPTASEIGLGWHHIAVTRTQHTSYIHVDGQGEVADNVESTMGSFSSKTYIGQTIVSNSNFDLHGVTIDEIRVSESARYSSNFDPPTSLVVEDDTVLLLSFDEGSGVATVDAVAEREFAITSATWTSGRS